MVTFMEQMRLSRGYSHQDLADAAGVSRPKMKSVLEGMSELTISQMRKIADAFEITIEELINEKVRSYEVNIEEENSKKLSSTIRVSVPQEKAEKMKELILYLTEKIGSYPNVGQTVLYKLLYFSDFDYYEKFEDQLIGARYIKNTFGPTPITFKKITDIMQKERILQVVDKEYYSHSMKKYLPLRSPNMKVFSADEIQVVDNVIQRLGKMSANQISEYSHKDVPWIGAEMGEEIDYEAVFYRTPETSVRSADEI